MSKAGFSSADLHRFVCHARTCNFLLSRISALLANAECTGFDSSTFLLYVQHSVCQGWDDVGPCRLGPSKIVSRIRKVLISAGLIQMSYCHTDRYCIPAPEAMPFLAVKSTNAGVSPTALNQQSCVNRVKVRQPAIHYFTRCALRIPPCS